MMRRIEPLHIADPKGSATGYVYNGFGEVIQSVSPDTGKTTYAYDEGRMKAGAQGRDRSRPARAAG